MQRTTADFINTLHLADAKFIKRLKIKLSARENDAIKSHGEQMYGAAASVTWHAVSRQTFFYK